MTSTHERTDADGRWTSPDGGKTWVLIEPSEAWLEKYPQDDDDDDQTTD